MKNPSPDEVKVARFIVDQARAALEEAKGHPDCAELAALLEARLAPCAELLENAHRRVELLDAAHVARTSAIADLHAAQAVPITADRAAILARRDEIDFRNAMVIIRDAGVTWATALTESPFRGVDRLINDSARRAAAGAVASLVNSVLTSDSAPPGTGSHRADPEQGAWEHLEMHVALKRVEAREFPALRFADKAGILKAAAACRVAFNQRITSRVSPEELAAQHDARRAASSAKVQARNAEVQARPSQPANGLGWRTL